MAKFFWDKDAQTFIEYDEHAAPPPSKFPAVWGDLPAYQSPITGQMVEGRVARREDLARTGSREVDPSERPAINPKTEKQAASEQAQLAARGAMKPALSDREMKQLLKPKT